MIPSDMQYLLSVVGLAPRQETIATWSPDQQREAEEWAIATHLRASDNDVDVPPQPQFLPRVWQGPYNDTDDVLGGPTPTVF